MRTLRDPRHGWFTPGSRHSAVQVVGLLSAMTGLMLCSKSALLDDLVGAGEQRKRDGETERLRRGG
jgi:hypothetical protein